MKTEEKKYHWQDFPWSYQTKADVYTHIIRTPSNGFVIQGRQDSSGEEQAKFKFIVESVNNYTALKEENQKLREALKIACGLLEGENTEWKSEYPHAAGIITKSGI